MLTVMNHVQDRYVGNAVLLYVCSGVVDTPDKYN